MMAMIADKCINCQGRLDRNGDGRLSADELKSWKPVDDFTMPCGYSVQVLETLGPRMA